MQKISILKRKFFYWFIRRTQRLVHIAARAYNLRVDAPCIPVGKHAVEIANFEYQAKHHIPASVYFNTACGKISVGDNTVFGEQVQLLTGMHLNVEEAYLENKPLHYVPEEGRDILIGSGCYIGGSAIIIGPVTIGDYAVIGAGSVVTKNVPSGAFVAGVPAKLIRQLQLPSKALSEKRVDESK